MKGKDAEKEGERTDGWMSLSCGAMVIYLLLDGTFKTGETVYL